MSLTPPGGIPRTTDDIDFTGAVRVNAGASFHIVDPTDATKILAFDLSTQTTGTTVTFVPVEGTEVTIDGTQTLTNKTLTAPTLNGGTWVATDSTFTIADNSAPTKIARFECSSLTAGTNVFTFPNTAADTLVTLAAAQTLVSKNLTAPTINAATLTGSISGGTFSSSTLTAPTINAATLTGAISGGTFSSSTLTAPTINAATLTGAISGGTLSSTTLTAPTINAATLTGAISGGTVAPTVLTVPASTALTTPALTAPTVATSLLITSTTGALGVPVMSEAQRDALTPAEGWLIYNVTTHKLNVRVAAAWEVIVSA